MQIWKAGPDVEKLLQKLIGKHHPNLLLIKDEIAVVFKEKASSPGGTAILGKSKKAPPLLTVFTGTDYKFIIELADDEWKELDSRQQQALLDHHLCSLVCEEDPESGGFKCAVRAPDVVGYREELKRWGMWRPTAPQVTPTLVEQMFGTDEEEDEEEEGE